MAHYNYPRAVAQRIIDTISASKNGDDPRGIFEVSLSEEQLKNLVKFPETYSSTLEHFCDDDWELLYEHFTHLKTWIESSRQICIEIGRRTKIIQEDQERYHTESEIVRRQTEEIDQELRLAIEAEVQPLARRVKDMFATVDKIMARKKCTPGQTGKDIGDADEDVEMVDVEAEAPLVDTNVEMTEGNGGLAVEEDSSAPLPKPDADSTMEGILAGFKNLQMERMHYKAKLRTVQDEVKSTLHACQLTGSPAAPKIRPVEITEEDLSVTVAQLVQECFPMFLRVSREIADIIAQDNSVALRVYDGLEIPLRTISLLLKRYKIPTDSLHYDTLMMSRLRP